MFNTLSSKLALALTVALVVGPDTTSAFQVATKAKTKEAAAKKEAAATKVDVNTADTATLETLPQIGPATAKKIVENRPYKSYQELQTKAGLNARALDAIQGRVLFGSTETTTATKKAIPRKTASPAPASPAPVSAAPTTVGVKKVDVNKADADELATLPGIGPALAKEIIAGRPYGTFEDLDEVKGMGPAKLAKLKDLVTVGSTTSEITLPKPEAKPETAKSDAGKPQRTSKKAEALAPGERVNINEATLTELQKLPGIGPVKGQAIIDGRPFQKPEDVMNVRGIKGATFERIKEHISVN